MAEDLREKIIETAKNKMIRLGIRSVSIDDICKELGISKKTFYVHFATKDEVVKAVLYDTEQQIDQKARKELARAKSVMDIIGENIDIIVERTKNILQPLPFLYDLQKYYPKLFEAHKQVVFVATKQHIMLFLQQGIEEGVFYKGINVPLTAEFLARLHQGLLEEIARRDDNMDNLSAMCCHGLGLIILGMLSESGKHELQNRVEKKNIERLKDIIDRNATDDTTN